MDDTQVLPDVLRRGLRIVFCGTAVGEASATRGTYYAGPGNSFWKTLHEIGLTPTCLAPDHFRMLTEYGLGLTDIAKMRSGNDAVLRMTDFDVDGFRAKVEKFGPTAIAFNGKKAASVYFNCDTAALAFGPQSGSSQPAVWVLPSTSGSARAFWDIEHWRSLAASVSR